MQVLAVQAVSAGAVSLVAVPLVAGSGAGGVQGLLPDVVPEQMKSASGDVADAGRARMFQAVAPSGGMLVEAAAQGRPSEQLHMAGCRASMGPQQAAWVHWMQRTHSPPGQTTTFLFSQYDVASTHV